MWHGHAHEINRHYRFQRLLAKQEVRACFQRQQPTVTERINANRKNSWWQNVIWNARTELTLTLVGFNSCLFLVVTGQVLLAMLALTGYYYHPVSQFIPVHGEFNSCLKLKKRNKREQINSSLITSKIMNDNDYQPWWVTTIIATVPNLLTEL